uniref:Secreted protein n=1 Tax=Ascaris lumbricoides TaxID=6252 RepID=A0A0M3HR68_ASCLU
MALANIHLTLLISVMRSLLLSILLITIFTSYLAANPASTRIHTHTPDDVLPEAGALNVGETITLQSADAPTDPIRGIRLGPKVSLLDG